MTKVKLISNLSLLKKERRFCFDLPTQEVFVVETDGRLRKIPKKSVMSACLWFLYNQAKDKSFRRIK